MFLWFATSFSMSQVLRRSQSLGRSKPVVDGVSCIISKSNKWLRGRERLMHALEFMALHGECNVKREPSKRIGQNHLKKMAGQSFNGFVIAFLQTAMLTTIPFKCR